MAYGLLTLIALLGLALGGFASRRRDGFFQAPLLRERIDALFTPFEGRQPSSAELEQLQRQASELFRDIITGLGYLPEQWSLHVHVDELLGPLPRFHGPDGQVLGLAVFDRRLRDGSLILPKP